jgi:hypothetical protein
MQLIFSEHLLALIVNGSWDFIYEIFLVRTDYADLVRSIDFKAPITITIHSLSARCTTV